MTVRLNNSKGYALFLSLLPILLMYKTPWLGLGVSTTLIAVGMAYAGIIIIRQSAFIQLKLIAPLIVFLLYAMTKSSIINIMLELSIIVHLVAISTGAVNGTFLKRLIEKISVFAAVLVIIQFVFHLIFRVHIPLIINSMCLDSLKYYSSQILTGVGRNTTMYRPCAFFLEPAHMTLYCMVGLMLTLYKEVPDYKKSILITAGIIATTSGMGIVISVAIWAIFPFVTSKGLTTDKIKRLVFLLFFGILAFAILSRIPFFQSAMARITGPIAYSSTQYNAIWGRTAKWDEFIKPMSGKDLIFGFGNVVMPNAYFTGLMTLIYSYGFVGVMLFYLSIGNIIIRKRNVVCCILMVVYGVMVTMADIVGFINVIFYFGCAIAIICDNDLKTMKDNERQ